MYQQVFDPVADSIVGWPGVAVTGSESPALVYLQSTSLLSWMVP